MSWERLGRIFVPDGRTSWMHSHAANPFALPLDDDLVRIYFSSRDEENRSSIGWLDYSMRDRAIARISERPVLAPGERGLFDDSGVSLGWIVASGERLLLYYAGWNLGVTIPFRNSIGLAVSTNGSAFERVSRAPILDRSDTDPFSLSYPCVLRRSESDWIMWYGSNLGWDATTQHVIKRATSMDGLHWRPTGEICIGGDDESAFSRPSVLVEDSAHTMWYSVRGRGQGYRIGCARSIDSLTWIRRDDKCGLGASGSGWDAREVEYPHVFRHRDETYMLYSGDGYGRGGFGIARLVR